MDSSTRHAYLLGTRKIDSSEVTTCEWRDILQAIVKQEHAKLKYLGMSPFESNFGHLILGSNTLRIPIIYEDDISQKTLCLCLGYADDFNESPARNYVGCRQALFVSAKGEFMLWATNYQYLPLNSRTNTLAWKPVASRAWKAREAQLADWLKQRDGLCTLKVFKSIVDSNVSERQLRLSAMQQLSWRLDEVINKVKLPDQSGEDF